MTRSARIAFATGLLPAACAGTAFIIMVALAVAVVERRTPIPASAPIVTAAGPTSRLAVDATYPVATWTVLVDGHTVAATASDARRWQGTLPDGRECTVEATPVDLLASGAAALRAHLDQGGRTRILDAWGDGAAGLRFTLEER